MCILYVSAVILIGRGVLEGPVKAYFFRMTSTFLCVASIQCGADLFVYIIRSHMISLHFISCDLSHRILLSMKS